MTKRTNRTTPPTRQGGMLTVGLVVALAVVLTSCGDFGTRGDEDPRPPRVTTPTIADIDISAIQATTTTFRRPTTTTTIRRPATTTTFRRPTTTTTVLRRVSLAVGTLAEEWCSNWLDFGTIRELRAVVAANPGYDWGWRDLDGNGYPCEDELGGVGDYNIPGVTRATTTTTFRRPTTTTTVLRRVSLAVGTLAEEWCSNWLDFGTIRELRAVVAANPGYDWGWRDLDGNGYPCEDELGGVGDYNIPGVTRATTTTTFRRPTTTTIAERETRNLAFRTLMATHSVFSNYPYSSLEELARLVCSELRRGVTAEDVGIAIYAFSPPDWDAFTVGEFVGYATGGFCPEFE